MEPGANPWLPGPEGPDGRLLNRDLPAGGDAPASMVAAPGLQQGGPGGLPAGSFQAGQQWRQTQGAPWGLPLFESASGMQMPMFASSDQSAGAQYGAQMGNTLFAGTGCAAGQMAAQMPPPLGAAYAPPPQMLGGWYAPVQRSPTVPVGAQGQSGLPDHAQVSRRYDMHASADDARSGIYVPIRPSVTEQQAAGRAGSTQLPDGDEDGFSEAHSDRSDKSDSAVHVENQRPLQFSAVHIENQQLRMQLERLQALVQTTFDARGGQEYMHLPGADAPRSPWQ